MPFLVTLSAQADPESRQDRFEHGIGRDLLSGLLHSCLGRGLLEDLAQEIPEPVDALDIDPDHREILLLEQTAFKLQENRGLADAAEGEQAATAFVINEIGEQAVDHIGSRPELFASDGIADPAAQFLRRRGHDRFS